MAARAGHPDALAPVLHPVHAGNGFEEALEQLLRLLRLGLVPPGGRLPAERALSERLGVSRMVLRDALRALADEGLVETRRGRYGGTFVLPPPPPPAGAADRRPAAADVEDALRFRAVLDVGAARLCAQGPLGPADAEELRAALAATRNAPTDGYRRTDTLLHMALAELSGSPTLAAQYAVVRADLNEMLTRIPLLVRNLEHGQRQHTALVEAVLAGDADTAASVMREHCEGTAALLRGFLS